MPAREGRGLCSSDVGEADELRFGRGGKDARVPLPDAATIQAIIDTADGDSAVAIGGYQYFTGTAPSAAGLAFLVNSATNPTDLNDPYYQNFTAFWAIALGKVASQAGRFDIVHNHLDFVAFPQARGLPCPMVSTVHG